MEFHVEDQNKSDFSLGTKLTPRWTCLDFLSLGVLTKQNDLNGINEPR